MKSRRSRGVINTGQQLPDANMAPPPMPEMSVAACAKEAMPERRNPHELRARLLAAHVALEAVRYDLEMHWEARNQMSKAIAARLGELELSGR